MIEGGNKRLVMSMFGLEFDEAKENQGVDRERGSTILDEEEKGRGQNRVNELHGEAGKETRQTLCADDIRERITHSNGSIILIRLHASLDDQVRVGDESGDELRDASNEENVESSQAFTLQSKKNTLEENVVNHWVGDQHKSREDTREKGRNAFLLNHLNTSRQSRLGSTRLGIQAHTSIDSPDGVGSHGSSGTGQSSDHDIVKQVKRLMLRHSASNFRQKLIKVVINGISIRSSNHSRFVASIKAGDAFFTNRLESLQRIFIALSRISA